MRARDVPSGLAERRAPFFFRRPLFPTDSPPRSVPPLSPFTMGDVRPRLTSLVVSTPYSDGGCQGFKRKKFSYKPLHYAENFLPALDSQPALYGKWGIIYSKGRCYNHGNYRKKESDIHTTPYARRLSTGKATQENHCRKTRRTYFYGIPRNTARGVSPQT